jgi:hypothetical protein
MDFTSISPQPAAPDAPCPYEPGEQVQVTGVYEICHKDGGKRTALLLRHQHFPQCNQCGMEVRFRLLRAAPHIREDNDFQA